MTVALNMTACSGIMLNDGLWRVVGRVCARAVEWAETDGDPGYISRKIRKFRTDKFDRWNKRKFWLMKLMVNGWEPAVYMSFMSQNFRLFHLSNLSVRNFRIFLLMYPGSVIGQATAAAGLIGRPRTTRLLGRPVLYGLSKEAEVITTIGMAGAVLHRPINSAQNVLWTILEVFLDSYGCGYSFDLI